jgi:hypothetical protein
MKKGRHCRCTVSAIELLSAAYKNCEQQLTWSMAIAMTQKDQTEPNLDLHIDELLAVTPQRAVPQAPDCERRRKPRLKEPFPARVWGVDSGALPFNIDCVLDNISSTGLYLRAPTLVDTGSEVRLVVHLLNGSSTGATASLHGRILRTELQADGKHGLAIAIENHSFL